MTKKSSNANLRKANKAKNDEFYTQLSDIEKELGHYKIHFKDKTIFCNCDDPAESNFFKYFALNFEHLGLKKLTATHFEIEKPSYKLEITRGLDLNHDGKIDLKDTKKIKLKQNGDFRSEECIELLKESDIVVTNPPFSLFREFIAQLMEYNKKFLIIGNQNALTYKEIFKIIKENKIWLGYTFPKDFKEANGNMKKFGNIAWYTNLEIQKRHEDLILYKTYKLTEYQKYYNLDAININKVKDIPMDYKGDIGVPITFLDKYNPEQFEIIGLGISSSGIEIGVRPYTSEHKKYRKEIQKRAAVDGDLYMIKDGIVEVPYARVIIKNKKL
ncbi:MAG: adenine-specific methyltransferase EcoRI family protein [Candidatus Gracilibacteria bacterium]|nr:adenine-specific methyltransferase EcoRI family protein [Candidatus Gracilibacteria bacterium]